MKPQSQQRSGEMAILNGGSERVVVVENGNGKQKTRKKLVEIVENPSNIFVPIDGGESNPDLKLNKFKTGFWRLSNVRFRLALILGGAMTALGFIRQNMSMAMVCMVNSTALAALGDDSKQFSDEQSNGTRTNYTSGACFLNQGTKNEYEGDFVWTSGDQAQLFSAYFWGGLLSGFPAGWLADRYGPKNIVLFGGIINIIGSLLSPITAFKTGYIGLFVLRFIMGIGQGCLIPCIGSMIARWFPPNEKSTVVAIFTSGNQLAGIIGLPLSAWLCQQKNFLGGWPAIFYVFGFVCACWSVSWYFLVTNTPTKHKKISRAEVDHIDGLLGQSLQDRKSATKNIPWKSIFKSGPVQANVLNNFTGAFFATLLLSYLPTYFKDVLFFDIRSNGLFSALPYLVQFGAKFVFAPTADYLKRNSSMSHTRICQIFNGIAGFGTPIFLVGLCFVTCENPSIAVFCFCGSMICFCGYNAGFQTSAVSIAPIYTGIINSLCRVAGQSGGVAAQYLSTQKEWAIVFGIVAVTIFLAGVHFVIFGSAEVQSWAIPPSTKQSQAVLITKSSASLFPTTSTNSQAAASESLLPPNPSRNGIEDQGKNVCRKNSAEDFIVKDSSTKTAINPSGINPADS